MREMLRPVLLIALVLAVPIVPFLAFGDSLESRVETWMHDAGSPVVFAVAVILLLGSDVLLPIPSSVLSTLAGDLLGFWTATATSWLGLTLGASLGYALARLFGRPLAVRLSSEEELSRMEVTNRRFGPSIVVLARPLPVLAEASVLWLGATGMPWWRFFLPVALSNLGIAVVYSALGQWVQLPIALAASLALPLGASILARHLTKSGKP